MNWGLNIWIWNDIVTLRDEMFVQPVVKWRDIVVDDEWSRQCVGESWQLKTDYDNITYNIRNVVTVNCTMDLRL